MRCSQRNVPKQKSNHSICYKSHESILEILCFIFKLTGSRYKYFSQTRTHKKKNHYLTCNRNCGCSHMTLWAAGLRITGWLVSTSPSFKCITAVTFYTYLKMEMWPTLGLSSCNPTHSHCKSPQSPVMQWTEKKQLVNKCGSQQSMK